MRSRGICLAETSPNHSWSFPKVTYQQYSNTIWQNVTIKNSDGRTATDWLVHSFNSGTKL